MTNYNEIVQLFKKKLQGTINLEEEKLLADWAKGNERREQLVKDISAHDILLEELELWLDLERQDEDPWEEKLLFLVQNKMEQHVNRRYTFLHKKMFYVAAIIVILCSAGLGIYLTQRERAPYTLTADEVLDVPPGTNSATITLADGRIVPLDKNKEGLVIGDGLTYMDGSVVSDLATVNSQNITLKVPKGGKYSVSLSDGSKVWLNAESELIYPSTFLNGKRFVELKGEAYFDIAAKTVNRKRVPFLVKTKNQVVEVLGTQFNVKAYSDEAETATVLIEGAVRIQSDGQQLHLSPGEMGISNSLGVRKISNVDTAEYLAWKNNKFIFNETPLKTALTQLSRWYNVRVEYDRGGSTASFYGEISRSKSLMSVLSILQESGVKFKLRKDSEGIILRVIP